MKIVRLLFLIVVTLWGYTLRGQQFYICRGGDVETAREISFSQQGTLLNGTVTTSTVDSVTVAIPRLRFVGGDLSLLPKYEQQQAHYRDIDGNTIQQFLTFLKEQGWNTLRVRLFVDPTRSDDKKSVVQDLNFVKDFARRIKDAGLLFMLDFHYSDTWADPGHQQPPADWTEPNLADRLYTYTKECLSQLVADGASPDFIQTGNEITFGMLWDTGKVEANSGWTAYQDKNWETLADYLTQAIRACREECPRAQIVIHTEQVAKNPALAVAFYNRIKQYRIDYDIIGISYYPYFHGPLEKLDQGLAQIERNFPDKHIQLVETGYPSKWKVEGTTYDYTNTYPYSHEGQRRFTTDLIALLKRHPQVNGLSWWYAEANASGTTGDLNTGWYNASLFDNETGRALPALYELQSFK